MTFLFHLSPILSFIYLFLFAATKSLQSCPTLRNPMDCSLPGSSFHGVFQARVLEWGAIAFSTSGELPGNYSNSPARAWQEGSRFIWAIDCRAHGSGKSQWAAGEVAAVLSFQQSIRTQQRPDLPLVFQPSVWCVFIAPQQDNKRLRLPAPR